MNPSPSATTHFAPAASLEGQKAREIARLAPTKIALIGTYVPRKCGIATFTSDLKSQVQKFYPTVSFDVFAIDRPSSLLVYKDGVHLISADDREAYRDAASFINRSGANAAWLQHEYGIFGGRDGDFVIELVDRLDVPLIVTLHTILAEPSTSQRRVLQHIVSAAVAVMVMSSQARDRLILDYHVPPDRVVYIPHGAPDRPFGGEGRAKARLGIKSRPVLMTFGLLGPGKGLEHVIEALPAIAARHPDVLYRMVGATHPDLVRAQGEAYREALRARVDELGVEKNVAWDNRFLDTDELLDQIAACDIYVTPYANLQQSTSGTLSYAVALGKAIVSTPYIHARELLADEVGVFVPVGDPAAIAQMVTTLLDDRARLAALKQRAYAAGRRTIWPRFAEASARLIAHVVERRRKPASSHMYLADPGRGELISGPGSGSAVQSKPDRDKPALLRTAGCAQ